jgi:NACalpha-BTF3-like transcription factor
MEVSCCLQFRISDYRNWTLLAQIASRFNPRVITSASHGQGFSVNVTKVHFRLQQSARGPKALLSPDGSFDTYFGGIYTQMSSLDIRLDEMEAKLDRKMILASELPNDVRLTLAAPMFLDQTTNRPAPITWNQTALNFRSELDEKDIVLVLSQTNESRSRAVEALSRNRGDVVNAIMDLTDTPSPMEEID